MNNKPNATSSVSKLENRVLSDNYRRKKALRSFFNKAGIFAGTFILLAVVVIVTTDAKLVTVQDFAEFALDFFLLLFCSYSMYVSCSDSGMRNGLQSEVYIKACQDHAESKKRIVEQKRQLYMHDFCRHYIAEEIKGVRSFVLANVALPYETYEVAYLGKDDAEIEGNEALSRVQKKAILSANAVEPIKLTPDMIMKRGRGGGRRSPLGMPPEQKKVINYAVKLGTSFLISLAISMIVLEVVVEPTWTLIATCFIKLLTVALNGFFGYKFGYENIVIDAANYIEDQVDLLHQAEQFCDFKKVGMKEDCT